MVCVKLLEKLLELAVGLDDTIFIVVSLRVADRIRERSPLVGSFALHLNIWTLEWPTLQIELRSDTVDQAGLVPFVW